MESALERYVLAGGFMMVFLVPLALMAVAFIVQGFINLRGARVCPGGFGERLGELVAEAGTSRERLAGALEREGHSLALILRRVVAHLDLKPDADAAEVLTQAVGEECDMLQQNNSQLAVVYTVAPLMGLLGTVFGMISTFREFAGSANPSVRELGAGVDVALLTTAWGLSIAIPAYIFLYLFTGRIQRYEQVVLPKAAGEGLEVLRRLGVLGSAVSSRAEGA